MQLFEIVVIVSVIVIGVGFLCFYIGRCFPKKQEIISLNTLKSDITPHAAVPYTPTPKGALEGNSALRRVVTEEKFKTAYISFMEQAEKNIISQKANGSRTPYGFERNRDFDGARLSQHFGQGAASMTPYLNWWVVSIYYIPSDGMIVIGIEEDRYPHINQMNPLRFLRIGNKNTRVAEFYSTRKNSIVWTELYDEFIRVSEEVMRLGLR